MTCQLMLIHGLLIKLGQNKQFLFFVFSKIVVRMCMYVHADTSVCVCVFILITTQFFIIDFCRFMFSS